MNCVEGVDLFHLFHPNKQSVLQRYYFKVNFKVYEISVWCHVYFGHFLAQTVCPESQKRLQCLYIETNFGSKTANTVGAETMEGKSQLIQTCL
jgi:hypothetical protein